MIAILGGAVIIAVMGGGAVMIAVMGGGGL